MKLLFLHVPHTGGRAVKRAFRKIQTSDIRSVHNAEDFKKLDFVPDIQYFILRPTVERIVGQVLHYSRNLKHVGQVNHLSIDKLPKGYDLDDPFHFIRLESNCNVYCKFLLHRKNFDNSITEDEFIEVCQLFESVNPPQWDLYEFPAKTLTLNKILGDLNYDVFQQSKKEDHEQLLENPYFVAEVKKLNNFDIRLYKLIQCK